MQESKEEFLKILANYQGILHKVSLVYFRSEADREDNFQEIVYQLWKSWPDLQKKDSIGSWIYSVAINTSLSRLKKNSRMEYRESIPEFSDDTSITGELVRNESFLRLLEAIHGLDEINRSVMLLYLEEKSYDEIAEILGITKSNVGVRISRAKEKLRKTLKL